MLYASTQPERELLSNRYGTRATQHIYFGKNIYFGIKSRFFTFLVKIFKNIA